MTAIETRSGCPPLSTLADWFDGTLAAEEADRVERHLDDCDSCRQRALEWSERLEGSASGAAASAGCIDAERLVAYSLGGLDAAATVEIERHLEQCARCVSQVQRFIRLEHQVEGHDSAPVVQADAAPAGVAAQTAEVSRRRAGAAVPTWWERLREILTPSLWTGAAFAAAMALVLAIGLSRFLSPSGPYEEMGVRDATRPAAIEITADTAGRPRPSTEEPVVAELPRGTQAQWLEASGDWTRIELEDGRRVWVDSKAVKQIRTD